MSMLTKTEAEALLKKVLSYSKAEACEVTVNSSDSGNLRYALNAVSTSGGMSKSNLSVRSFYGNKEGIATINEFDDASLMKTVKRSEELAQLAPENPEYVPLSGPQVFAEAKTFIPATAAITPKYLANETAKSLEIAKANKLTAAGFIDHSHGFTAVMNSKGLFAYNTATEVSFSVTLRTADGTGSGYAAKTYNDVAQLDIAKLSSIAADKAVKSTNAKALEPGKYTVILEADAAESLLQGLFNGLDARSADEGRSFLSKGGGKTKLGDKLLDEQVTFYSDPLTPELPGNTWTGDGRPQEKMVWIENGVVKNLYYSRYWAQKQGVKATPRPSGIIMKGTNASLEDLIKGTERGILVTRFWYIRAVDPRTLLYTGLTRDGTFYIENGKIMYPVKNFRFNESPIIMLNNLDALGKPERIGNSLIPPMRIRDFTFSSLSDAV